MEQESKRGNEEKLVLVYKSMICSILEYAVEAWLDLPHYLSGELEKYRNEPFGLFSPALNMAKHWILEREKSRSQKRKLV